MPVEFPWRSSSQTTSSVFSRRTPSAAAAAARRRKKKTTATTSPTPSPPLSRDSREQSPPRIVEVMSEGETDVPERVFPARIPTAIHGAPRWPAGVETKSWQAEQETDKECLNRFLDMPHPTTTVPEDGEETELPGLTREKHILYLRSVLQNEQKLHYTSEPSKPWMIYWALNSLAGLGEDIESEEYRKGISSALIPSQSPTGGFGGGHGHISHCAPSYAGALSLCLVGGYEARSLVDRKGMWEWLGQMKQPNGGFIMHEGGELDVRGAFCTLVILSVLDLPVQLPPDAPARKAGLKTFICKLPEWISDCQSYEGGIGSVPGGEAHGAFAFCALNTLGLLGPPEEIVPRYLRMGDFFRWMSYRQCAQGGFAGRANKLVDGCYSFWNGGTMAIIDSIMDPGRASGEGPQANHWGRAELINYILHCCQNEYTGGLVDKPGMRTDPYHTLYNIMGLSMAQNRFFVRPAAAAEWAAGGGRPRLLRPGVWDHVQLKNPGEPGPGPKETWAGEGGQTSEYSSRVKVYDPIYALPWGVAEKTWAWFRAQPKEEWETNALAEDSE